MPRPTVSQNPRLPGVKNIIAVAAGKGGVGKSTVTTNLAAALYRSGASVGILDADIYGPSIPQMMGDPDVPAAVDTGNKITPAIHHGLRRHLGRLLRRARRRRHLARADGAQAAAAVPGGRRVGRRSTTCWSTCRPGTGDAQLSLSQLIPITGAVMVTTPQEVSVIDVEKAMAMWKRVEVPVLGVVENMSYYVCPTCGHHDEIFSRGGGQRLAEREKRAVPGRGAAGARRCAARATRASRRCWRMPDSPVAQVFRDIAEQVACALSVRNMPEPGSGKRSSKLTLIR